MLQILQEPHMPTALLPYHPSSIQPLPLKNVNRKEKYQLEGSPNILSAHGGQISDWLRTQTRCTDGNGGTTGAGGELLCRTEVTWSLTVKLGGWHCNELNRTHKETHLQRGRQRKVWLFGASYLRYLLIPQEETEPENERSRCAQEQLSLHFQGQSMVSWEETGER